MTETLSGVGIIICMALGLLMFIQLFIFVKRQIVRFALKFRFPQLGVLAPDAPKSVRAEIERRIEIVRTIRTEPQLLFDEIRTDDVTFSHENTIHIWRMRAVDQLPRLDASIALAGAAAGDMSPQQREAYQDLGSYLKSLIQRGSLQVKQEVVDEFVALYNHARLGIKLFGENEFLRFETLVDRLCDAIVFNPKDLSHMNSHKNNDQNGGLIELSNGTHQRKKFSAKLNKDGRLGAALLIDHNQDATDETNHESRV